MMKTKYYFNMVEIALAIAIIAIGISAILVLFPIGINATRAAMDENSSTDVTEFVANFVRGQYLTKWKENFENWRADYKTWRGTNPVDLTTMPQQNFANFAPGTNPPFPESIDDNYSTGVPNGATLSEVVGYTDKTTTPNSGLQKLTNGVYLFTKVTDSGEESFSALVKIWAVASDLQNTATDPLKSPQCPIYVPDAASSFTPKCLGSELKLPSPAGGEIDIGQFVQSALVEISWPAHMDERERTKRVFRVDVYNPYYTIQPTTTP